MSDPILLALRDIVTALDPVPERVYSAGYAAGAPIEGERLELVEDSAVAEPAGMRGPGGPRLVRFDGNGSTVELEITTSGPHTLRLRGLLAPSAAGTRISARWPAGRTSSDVDELGQFLLTDVPSGPLRLELTGERSWRTRWILG
jgi:hypothetical protein